MNAYASALSAAALKSSVTTAVTLILFFAAACAAMSTQGHESIITLVAVVTAWTAPLVSLGALGITINALVKLKRL